MAPLRPLLARAARGARALPAALPRAPSQATLVGAQVFLAGAGVMALEMLGGRLLAPRFGSTIYTWGSLIGVVMAALAAGYYLGGRLGDARPRPGTLSLLLLGAGALALLLPLLAPAVLGGVASLLPDPRTGPLLASALLLAPPSLVLGAATPVAVRLAGGPAERAGSTAGSMAGLSTTGSILGTFATVFVLIPALEVGAILLGVGLLLGAASLLTAERRGTSAALLGALLVVSPLGQAALGPALLSLGTGITDEVLHRESTPYHELYVVQERVAGPQGHVRTLILDGNRHSAMFTGAPAETPFRYPEYFHLGPLLQPDAARALFIGGGGMTGPKQFLLAYPQMEVDSVEVDPGVVEAAARWFAAPDDPRLRVHVEDGRQFLARTNATWDVIVLDAYGRNYVPFHLMTLEFLALVRERLAPGGVVVSNLIGATEGSGSLLLRSEARTFAAVFPWTQHALTRPGLPAIAPQNVMLLAALAEPPGWAGAAARAEAWAGTPGRAYAEILSHVQAQPLRRDDVAIFRDDFAPVEALISPLTGQPYDPAG